MFSVLEFDMNAFVDPGNNKLFYFNQVNLINNLKQTFFEKVKHNSVLKT